MQKTYARLIILSMAFLSFLSCKKELQQEPVSSISATSFWKTENDATGALYGMYARFRNVTGTNLFLWGEARSMVLKQSIGNDFANVRIFDNTLDATAAGPEWGTLYTVISDANLILENVPKIQFIVEANKNNILAQAYTMRAYCYFVIVRTWGKAPIVTEPTLSYDPAVIYKERSSVEDVFKLIKQDITTATGLYPNNNFATQRSLWSKPGLSALKGDVYLWTGKKLNGGTADFQTALEAFNNVDVSNVLLLPNFKDIFDYNNKNNKEIIVSDNFSLNESGGTFMVNLGTGTLPTDVPQSTKDSVGISGGSAYWTVTDQTRSLFNVDDQRKKATFIEVYRKNTTTGLYTNLYVVAQRKFLGVADAGTQKFLSDVILYRYGGVLLLKAETENALGLDPSTSINKVRTRAYQTNYPRYVFVSGSKAYNDSIILNERLQETLYEGTYWWDILRNDKATVRIPYFQSRPADTYKYLWPLSLNVLSLEPKASQNPGYN